MNFWKRIDRDTFAVGFAATLVVGATLGAVAACSTSGATGEPAGDKGTTVTEVRLSDGTRCAVMDKSQGAAISCDWGGAR